MNKTQKFIKTRKRKKKIRKVIVVTIVSIFAIITFIYKTPIFNIEKINITGEKTVSENELQEVLKEYIGQNIFTINYKEMKEKILVNKYIEEVTISKKSKNKLEVLISEGNISYYIQDGDEYKIITNDGYYVERLDTIEGLNLVNIIGIKDNSKGIGEKIIEDENFCKILSDFHPVLKPEDSDLRIEKLDLTNVMNIKGYIGNIEIRFGDSSNLMNEYDKSGGIEEVSKINKALNIVEQKNMQKGYIDVSFDGSPVVKIES